MTIHTIDRSTLAGRLRFKRQERRLTQAQLAERAGCSQQTIAKIESGQVRRPQWETLMGLADVLGVKPAWLMFGVEALDELDETAIQIALLSQRMTPQQRQALEAHLRTLTNADEKPNNTTPLLPTR